MNWKRVGLVLLGVSLFVQALGAAIFVTAADFALIDQGDSFEYITIADNMLTGRGYSGEDVEPYRPTTSRGPGMLVVNLPFRLLFANSDVAAVVAAKGILLVVAILAILVASYFAKSPIVYLVAPILTILPTIAYYFVNPYASSPTLLLSMCFIYLSMVLILKSKRFAVVMLIFASIYAISSREAALFPLIWIVVFCFFLGFLHKSPDIKHKFRLISVAVLIGTASFYLLWSYRNLSVFDKFQFSSIQGFNLLHATAFSMIPYLDEDGKAEVVTSLDSYPIYITRYHESDQLEVGSQQGEEGKRLIKKYPVAFLTSQIVGSLKGLFVFDVDILQEKLGTKALVVATIVQIIITISALIGLARLTLELDSTQRLALALIVTTGLVGLLAGASFGEPRFRIPLEPMTALGCTIFFRDFVVPLQRLSPK